MAAYLNFHHLLAVYCVLVPDILTIIQWIFPFYGTSARCFKKCLLKTAQTWVPPCNLIQILRNEQHWFLKIGLFPANRFTSLQHQLYVWIQQHTLPSNLCNHLLSDATTTWHTFVVFWVLTQLAVYSLHSRGFLKHLNCSTLSISVQNVPMFLVFATFMALKLP